MSSPNFRPRTPYTSNFPSTLRLGAALRVRGVVNEDAQRIKINFNCDQDGEKVALHFNPRQDQEDVVLNSRLGDWGNEERGQSWFPFQRGKFFNILFMTFSDSYNIYVNNRFFTSYRYRVPPNQVKFLEIKGDVNLMDVKFTDPMADDFIKTVPSGFEKHDVISVKGFFYPGGNRVIVNLLEGNDIEDDIALQFNPRRDDGEVVLKSKHRGIWEQEERHQLPTSMLDLVPFNVEFLNKDDHFEISINGEKLYSFKSSGSNKKITGIHTNGEAFFYEVTPLKRVNLPLVYKLPYGLEPESWISLTGTPYENPYRFAINLQKGDDLGSGSDIALQINPRFDQNTTIYNTRQGGVWGMEEKDQPNFPFKAKEKFEINILVTPTVYRIFVNGQKHVEYSHRIEAGPVSHLLLKGDCDFFEPEYF